MRLSLNLLLVEDSEENAQRVIDELRHGGFEPTVTRVPTKTEFRKSLRQDGWQAVIASFDLPRFKGREIFKTFMASGVDLPFILISDGFDGKAASELLAEGAHDFIERESLYRLAPALQRELRAARLRHSTRELSDRDKMLAQLFHSSTALLDIKDPEGRYLAVNREYESQRGATEEELRGKTPEAHLPAEAAEVVMERHREVVQTGRGLNSEIAIRYSDGSLHHLFVTKFPIRNEDGDLAGVASVATDITERKLAELELWKKERLFRAVIDNSPTAISLKGMDGRFILVNTQWEKQHDLSGADAIGKTLYDIFPEGQAAQLDDTDRLVMETKMPVQFEAELTAPSGLPQTDTVIKFPILDPDGNIAGVGSACINITERKRAEEALERSEERFRDFAEASSDWMWETDSNHRFTYISGKIFEITGIRVEKVIGRTREELDTDGNWQVLNRTLKQRKPFRDFEYTLINESGHSRVIRISGKPRFDENKEFLGYRGTGSDVTEQRATEQREARTRQRFLDAIETVPVGFALYDSEDRLVLWNNLYETLAVPALTLKVGMPFDQILRQSIEKTPFENSRDREDDWFEDRMSHHRDPKDPLVLKRGDTCIQVREHRTPDGSTLLVVVDISDLQRAEHSLRESERQLKAILDNIPEMAWLKDRDNHFIAVNEAFASVCGKDPRDLVGKTDIDIWPSELAIDYMSDDEEVKRTKTRKRIEELVEQSDGRRFWVETIKTPIFNDHGEVVGTVGTGRDITERKNTEQTLRKLSAAVEQSPAAILITNLDGSIEYANPRFFETTGYDVWEILGKTPSFLKSDYSDPSQFDRMWAALRAGREWRGEIRTRRKNGEAYWSSIAVSPITNTQGEITNFLSIAEDTTEKRRMDEQLRHAQKLEAVGTLAGGVAHDFNNILTGILGHSHIAVEKLDPDDPVQFNLTQIRVASDRAKDLVQQLLAFSRRREANLRTVNLHSIVDEAVKLIHASIPPIIKIHWNVADDAGTVMADPTQIHQVLLNLCSNAADAIGDEPGTIDISVENVDATDPIAVAGGDLAPGQYARLSVSDTGCGMDSYTQSRAFDPFFTTKPVGSGTGLGLAAVHGIIQDHGGGIELKSSSGEGSIFNIYLPCVGSEEMHSRKSEPRKFSGNERILLVDDERMVLQSIGPYLEHFGYKVEALTSPKAALAVFQSMPDQFDLLITDQMMPGMTGDVLASEVRAIRPDIPIILCTGYAAPSALGGKQMAKLDEIVRKPVEPSELGHVIRKTLDQRS